jgi:hypothetical protein
MREWMERKLCTLLKAMCPCVHARVLRAWHSLPQLCRMALVCILQRGAHASHLCFCRRDALLQLC